MKERTHPTLLHCGIAGGSLSMWPLCRFLRKSGILAERVRSPIVLAGSIAHYAAGLRKCIARLHDKTGANITLVGWSLGGLISVDAMSCPETARCVRRIITFGTPFDGSCPAHIVAHRPGQFLLKAPKEIIPGAPTLTRLQTLINDPSRPWEIATINGPAHLDPLAPSPLKLVEPDLRLEKHYTHMALFGNRTLHRLVTDLILASRFTPADKAGFFEMCERVVLFLRAMSDLLTVSHECRKMRRRNAIIFL